MMVTMAMTEMMQAMTRLEKLLTQLRRPKRRPLTCRAVVCGQGSLTDLARNRLERCCGGQMPRSSPYTIRNESGVFREVSRVLQGLECVRGKATCGICLVSLVGSGGSAACSQETTLEQAGT